MAAKIDSNGSETSQESSNTSKSSEDEIATLNTRSEPIVYKPELSWPSLKLQIVDESDGCGLESNSNAASDQNQPRRKKFYALRKRFGRIAHFWQGIRSRRYEQPLPETEIKDDQGEHVCEEKEGKRSRIVQAFSNFRKNHSIHINKESIAKKMACANGLESDDEYYKKTTELLSFENPNYEEQKDGKTPKISEG